MAVNRATVDVVGVGEAMVLLEPQDGSLTDTHAFTAFVAGAELNACSAVAALGGRTVFATRLGQDPFGDRIRGSATASGVEIDDVVDESHPTGVFFKEHVVDGPRRVYYYRRESAASRLGPGDMARVLAHSPRAVLLSGVTAALGPGAADLSEMLAAQLHGSPTWLVLDVNLRPTLGRLGAAVKTLHAMLPAVRILVTGTDEGAILFGTGDPVAIAREARLAGCEEVVVTGGPDGCWWMEGEHLRHMPSSAQHVVDPVGAGDAFTGGYTWSRLRGLGPESAALVGSRLAALVLAHHGDITGLQHAGKVRDLLDQLLADPDAA